MLLVKNIMIIMLGSFLAFSSTGSFEDESCPVSVLNPPEINHYLLYNRLTNIVISNNLSFDSLREATSTHSRTRPLLEALACYQDIDPDIVCAFWGMRDKFEDQNQQKGGKCRLSAKQSPNELFSILYAQYYILNDLDKRTNTYCDQISVGRFKDISFIQKYVKENITPVGIFDTSVGDQFYYGALLKGFIYFIRGVQEDEPGHIQRAKGLTASV